MVRLKDIAEAAHVSVPLVSKVLNNRLGSTGASEQTIRTVRRIARQMGYRRNEAAAALRRGRQGVVGVLIHPIGALGSGLNESLIEGVASACATLHLKQQLTFYTDVERVRRDVIAGAHPSSLDGLILGGAVEPELVDDLLGVARRGVPVVTVRGSIVHPDIPNCGCDDVEIGRMAAGHLLERGCRRIAHLCAMEARDRGYRAALDAAGVEAGPVVGVEGFDHHAGAAAVEALLAGGESFAGVVADSDQLAMGAMRALSRADRRVPADVKVIGVDDSPFCECTVVSLSSVSGCDRQRGAAAVEMLENLRQGKETPSRFIRPELCVRESTA